MLLCGRPGGADRDLAPLARVLQGRADSTPMLTVADSGGLAKIRSFVRAGALSSLVVAGVPGSTLIPEALEAGEAAGSARRK